MKKYIIVGGNKLFGSVNVPCSKNAYLPILAGCILCDEEIILKDCPNFEDIKSMCDILKELGASVIKQGTTLCVNCKNITNHTIPHNLSGKIRSSIFSLGAILSRLKRAIIAYPGGCDIGSRPIDLHIKGLEAMGVKIQDKHGFLNCDGCNLAGGTINLDFPSVGATENIILAGILAKGETKIINCAKEPEIVDLANFLNKMGANICGEGTSTITIQGVKKLHGIEYTPISDRIITGTYAIATAICGGKVELNNANQEHIHALISKINNNCCKVEIKNNKILVTQERRPKSFQKLETMPYPGFPTDLQSQIVTLASISKGTSIITENLFETRFKHVPELVKMGANIVVKGKTAVVAGVSQLYGAEVNTSDLRGGAALVLAGLGANGYTTVNGIEIIDRGYENFEQTLTSLGADIKRVEQN
ncbi:MAG: UDP-N-acetylglucosamine 1-carboxyvinyltransferase [Clostridia bacterium]